MAESCALSAAFWASERAASIVCVPDITLDTATDMAVWYCGNAGVMGMVALFDTDSLKMLNACF